MTEKKLEATITEIPGGKIRINNARLSFPHLTEVDSFGKYSCTLIVDKDSPAGKFLVDKVRDMYKAAFGKKAEEVKAADPKKYPLKDGDKSKHQSNAGKLLIGPKATEENRGKVKFKSPTGVDYTEKEIKQMFYAGCYVNAIVSLFSYSNKYGKGVGVGLVGLQFLRDGDALAGAPTADDDDFDKAPVSEEQPWA